MSSPPPTVLSNSQEQAYQLKSVMYHGSSRKILLQNENGPCPLLAVANALLLRGEIDLDPACVRSGVACTDDVVNALAERAAANAPSRSAIDEGEYRLNEALELLPPLRHGMDVNPPQRSIDARVAMSARLSPGLVIVPSNS